jgi:hypothetical protein
VGQIRYSVSRCQEERLSVLRCRARESLDTDVLEFGGVRMAIEAGQECVTEFLCKRSPLRGDLIGIAPFERVERACHQIIHGLDHQARSGWD